MSKRYITRTMRQAEKQQAPQGLHVSSLPHTGPVGGGVSLTSMAMDEFTIERIAKAIRTGKLSLSTQAITIDGTSEADVITKAKAFIDRISSQDDADTRVAPRSPQDNGQ